jgi:hypothetical protein
LFLKQLRTLAIVATAAFGLRLFWVDYRHLAGLSWWYASTRALLTESSAPDFTLPSLPWQPVHPRAFEPRDGRLTLVTSAEPFAYQAFAMIDIAGAKSAGIKFDAQVDRGGVTIGLLQGGRWIAISSLPSTGRFSEVNVAQLGFRRRPITVMIANRNPEGESRVTINALQVYLLR